MHSLKTASFIYGVGKYSAILIQLVVNVILSRILTPYDYGIVAIITVFATFFGVISDMGISAAIVQNKRLDDNDIGRIYAFSFIIAIVLIVLFIMGSFFVAIVFGEKDYINLGGILSISLFFNSMNMVPNGILNREKKFGVIAYRTIIASLFSGIVAIVVAYCGGRYYSIAIQSVITSVTIFLLNYIKTRPHLIFDNITFSVKKIIRYSTFQFGFNLINYFSRNLDNILIGKFFGTVDLGYYYKAYNLMLYPVNNLTGVLTPVLHPILSDYQSEKKLIYLKYIKITKLLILVGAFISPLCYLASDEIVFLFYGNQWNESAKCFSIFSYAILPQIVGSIAGAIYQSLGKTDLLFYNGILNTIITVTFVILGVFYGGNIEVLSIFVTISYIIHFLIISFMIVKLSFMYDILNFFDDISKELIICLGMIASTLVYDFYFMDVCVSFIIKVVYIFLCLLIFLIFTSEYKFILSIVKRKA